MVSVDMLTYDDAPNTKPVADLRKDMLSLHHLIHTSTTRLSVSLGKPPPSYSLAQVPLKDLVSQVVQLTSCACSYPPGILRREAIWASEGTIRALAALVRHFEKQCRQGETSGEEYLAKTGAIHDAVTKAENLSNDETEAIIRAWKVNGESLEDSLKEVKEMEDKDGDEEQEQSNEDGGDGWDELGEEFGRKLKPEEMQRVKQIYPLMRFTTLLHAKILSHHILTPPGSQPHPVSHLNNLLAYSNSLPVAHDELASSLYAPQDVEGIKEAAQLVYDLTQDLDQELGVTEASTENLVAERLAKLHIGSGSQSLTWFRKCFSQINSIYNGLVLSE
ncbi:hypothetical protein JB92DRAFT_923331 [Gautieria morchelliformis]|nr:hypothetical protein JB92DRAFT_923331 [Gautieria morchelliformis]